MLTNCPVCVLQARRDAALHGQWAAAGATLASDPALALDYTDLEEVWLTIAYMLTAYVSQR